MVWAGPCPSQYHKSWESNLTQPKSKLVLSPPGYEYYYPFLDESSGVQLDPHSVVPLYRYTVNINQPTMFFMGLFIRACLVVALDAQVSSVCFDNVTN